MGDIGEMTAFSSKTEKLSTPLQFLVQYRALRTLCAFSVPLFDPLCRKNTTVYVVPGTGTWMSSGGWRYQEPNSGKLLLPFSGPMHSIVETLMYVYIGPIIYVAIQQSAN